MKTARTVGLLVVGALVGMLITLLLGGRGSLDAQRGQAQPTRLTVTTAYALAGQDLKFVSDAKSGGCWLYAVGRDNGGTAVSGALTVAPKEACD